MSLENTCWKLSLPFTVIPSKDMVRLIAGEDLRYTLSAKGLEQWLPSLLTKLDGTVPLSIALEQVNNIPKQAAKKLIEGLISERVLVESIVQTTYGPFSLELVGSGIL